MPPTLVRVSVSAIDVTCDGGNATAAAVGPGGAGAVLAPPVQPRSAPPTLSAFCILDLGLILPVFLGGSMLDATNHMQSLKTRTLLGWCCTISTISVLSLTSHPRAVLIL